MAWIGNTSVWPLTPDNLLFHWMLAWPLAPLVSSMVVPKRRIRVEIVQRVLTPQEQQAVLVQGKSGKVQHHRHRASKSQRPRKASSDSAMNASNQSTKPVVPSPTSFWGRIDWSQVPDDNPLKREAMAAAQLLTAQSESAQTGPIEALSKQNQSAESKTASPGASHFRVLAQSSDENGDWDADTGVLKL